MSILETFYILFKSDSKDVKKGAKDAEKAAKDLNKTLEQTDAKSEKVGQSFLNMSNSALKAFASIASVGGVFASLRNTIQGVNELAQVGAPLAILTLSDEPDARAHLVAAVAAAARARAVLLIEDAGGLRGPVAELLELELERTTAAAVVSCEGPLPLALTALASAALDAAATPEAR